MLRASIMNATPSPVRVLVAEDDADMRALVAATLRADGYDVDEAFDGSDALMSITTSRVDGHDDYDLVLSDVRMPVMTGVELATRLKRMGYATPLLLMSAFADEALHAASEEARARHARQTVRPRRPSRRRDDRPRAARDQAGK